MFYLLIIELIHSFLIGQNNGGYSAPPVQDIQPHYSSNVVPAAANLPVTHSMEKNNYYNNEGDKPSFNEKPLYADKQTYPDKVDDYQKVNHNLNNNLQNNGYGKNWFDWMLFKLKYEKKIKICTGSKSSIELK